jgi:FtsP/CotA-like multicopper oxidase with cupredoxin domain
MSIKLSAISLSCVLCVAIAQDATKVQEPEFIGIFTVLDASGVLQPLERQATQSQVKTKMMGYRGGTATRIITGTRSPVRFPAGQKLEFVVKLDTKGQDPSLFVHLAPLVVEKHQREFVIAKAGAFGRNARSTANDTLVATNVAKYGEQSYRIVPIDLLAPGEYAIGSTGGLAFCFGVDAK